MLVHKNEMLVAIAEVRAELDLKVTTLSAALEELSAKFALLQEALKVNPPGPYTRLQVAKEWKESKEVKSG